MRTFSYSIKMIIFPRQLFPRGNVPENALGSASQSEQNLQSLEFENETIENRFPAPTAENDPLEAIAAGVAPRAPQDDHEREDLSAQQEDDSLLALPSSSSPSATVPYTQSSKTRARNIDDDVVLLDEGASDVDGAPDCSRGDGTEDMLSLSRSLPPPLLAETAGIADETETTEPRFSPAELEKNFKSALELIDAAEEHEKIVEDLMCKRADAYERQEHVGNHLSKHCAIGCCVRVVAGLSMIGPVPRPPQALAAVQLAQESSHQQQALLGSFLEEQERAREQHLLDLSEGVRQGQQELRRQFAEHSQAITTQLQVETDAVQKETQKKLKMVEERAEQKLKHVSEVENRLLMEVERTAGPRRAGAVAASDTRGLSSTGSAEAAGAVAIPPPRYPGGPPARAAPAPGDQSSDLDSSSLPPFESPSHPGPSSPLRPPDMISSPSLTRGRVAGLKKHKRMLQKWQQEQRQQLQSAPSSSRAHDFLDGGAHSPLSDSMAERAPLAPRAGTPLSERSMEAGGPVESSDNKLDFLSQFARELQETEKERATLEAQFLEAGETFVANRMRKEERRLRKANRCDVFKELGKCPDVGWESGTKSGWLGRCCDEMRCGRF